MHDSGHRGHPARRPIGGIPPAVIAPTPDSDVAILSRYCSPGLAVGTVSPRSWFDPQPRPKTKAATKDRTRIWARRQCQASRYRAVRGLHALPRRWRRRVLGPGRCRARNGDLAVPDCRRFVPPAAGSHPACPSPDGPGPWPVSTISTAGACAAFPPTVLRRRGSISRSPTPIPTPLCWRTAAASTRTANAADRRGLSVRAARVREGWVW
jgi:hypothetical protein